MFALTIFAVPYASEGLGLDPLRGLAAISAFWFGLLAGRVGLLVLPREVGASGLAVAGLAGAALLWASVRLGLAGLETGFALIGAALGFVFPLMIALAGQRFPESRGTATGLVAGAAALGGFAIPWLHGAVGDHTTVVTAVGTLALWCLVIAAAAWTARRH